MLIILVMEPGTYATYAGFEDVADVRSRDQTVSIASPNWLGELVRGYACVWVEHRPSCTYPPCRIARDRPTVSWRPVVGAEEVTDLQVATFVRHLSPLSQPIHAQARVRLL
jgi:hypothetical protein